LGFFDHVIEEIPIQIQRIQTDRGFEFLAREVQYKLKFRSNKPASPHLNGKVESSQETDKAEFYVTVDLESEDLSDQLAEWQRYYNWGRPRSADNGKSPIENTSIV